MTQTNTSRGNGKTRRVNGVRKREFEVVRQLLQPEVMQGSLQRAEFLIVYSFHAKADADAKAALCNTGDHPNHRFFVRAAGEDMKKAAREVAQ